MDFPIITLDRIKEMVDNGFLLKITDSSLHSDRKRKTLRL